MGFDLREMDSSGSRGEIVGWIMGVHIGVHTRGENGNDVCLSRDINKCLLRNVDFSY